MTHQNDYTLTDSLIANGLEAIPELVRALLNKLMQIERTQHIQAGEYERTETRKGHANGYKPKAVKIRVGEITFVIPQVLECKINPSALEKGLRSERAVVAALLEHLRSIRTTNISGWIKKKIFTRTKLVAVFQ